MVKWLVKAGMLSAGSAREAPAVVRKTVPGGLTDQGPQVTAVWWLLAGGGLQDLAIGMSHT